MMTPDQRERPIEFQSFFWGGFECSSHRRDDGTRLDLLRATGHDKAAADDYRLLNNHGVTVARDGVRWNLVEGRAGTYDWSSVLPMVHAAAEVGVHVVWDICHYGWPDHIDIWRPEFVRRFARYCAAFASVIRDQGDAIPCYTLINEISYWAWAGGTVGVFNPCSTTRALELKQQLVRASIEGMLAIREVDSRARFIAPDPLINIRAMQVCNVQEAEPHCAAQFEGWDMLAGHAWPGLGGGPEYIDIIGVNYYPQNQWFVEGGLIEPWQAEHRPLSEMLKHVHGRYGRPIVISETGAEGKNRGVWLRQVTDEVLRARSAGTPVQGLCLYPILDYPGWVDNRHCETGLFGPVADDFRESKGIGPANAPTHRATFAPLAEALHVSQRAVAECKQNAM
jgi:beta-glucosidase/6-phospho-beta-glucosidase/beta-galactosidase